MARRADDGGVALFEALAGETITDLRIASWAIAQHATAIQKTASTSRKGMAG
jgi:hypothetical protein